MAVRPDPNAPSSFKQAPGVGAHCAVPVRHLLCYLRHSTVYLYGNAKCKQTTTYIVVEP